MIKFLVRISPLIMNVYIAYVLINSCIGRTFVNLEFVLGNSLLLDFLLLLLCNSQEKYNCKYVKYLIYNLIFTSIFMYTNDLWRYVPKVKDFISILSITWISSMLITIFLALKHFIRVCRIKKNRTKCNIPKTNKIK